MGAGGCVLQGSTTACTGCSLAQTAACVSNGAGGCVLENTTTACTGCSLHKPLPVFQMQQADVSLRAQPPYALDAHSDKPLNVLKPPHQLPDVSLRAQPPYALDAETLVSETNT